MRNLSAQALAKIQQDFGSEPITIVEVEWTKGGTQTYADRTINDIPGRILSIGRLDALLDITRSNTTQELNMELDDSDGFIKSVIDKHDVHQVPVRVYQYFTGLDISEKFLVFSGRLNSPFEWAQATQSLSFSVISQIEDREFGFSAEEGQIPGLPSTLVGRPWPSIFGTVLDVPALQIGSPVTGTTLCGVGYLAGRDNHLNAPIGGVDCGTGISLSMISVQLTHLNRIGGPNRISQQNALRRQAADITGRIRSREICAQLQRSQDLAAAEELGEGCNPVRILGGEDFPQGRPIQIEVGSILLTGVMNGQDFTISRREQAETDEAAALAQEQITSIALCSDSAGPTISPFDLSGNNASTGAFVRTHGFVICTLPANDPPPINQALQHVFADAGARVSIVEGDNIAYIASITPGTVLDVKAFKQFEGEQRLVSVPTEFYNVTVEDFGPVKATVIRMSRALSSREGEGFSDDVFVTFRSDIGPNTVDIMEYIIDLYTDLTVDRESFDAVRKCLIPFPSHFAILDRRNTIDLIKDIAFQCRCGVYVSDGTFFLRYLPEEPESDLTVTQGDIELRSVVLTTTNSEELVTKMNIEYLVSYAEEPQRIVLRNNIARYGTREQDFNWFIYSNADVVYHAASFWLIRLSNTWKRLRFTGFLNLLPLESFDTITLDEPNYVASGPIKAVVDNATYDSDNNQIAFEVEVPVVMGFLEQHPFYWPKDSNLTYPSDFDTSPGGGGIGSQASGVLPYVGTSGGSGTSGGGGDNGNLLAATPFEGLPAQTVLNGGPNTVFGAQSDLGTRTPGDGGFSTNPVVIESAFANVVNTNLLPLDLTFSFLDALPAEPLIDLEQPLVLDIRNTVVVDSEQEGQTARLDQVFAAITNNQLVFRTDVLWREPISEGLPEQGKFAFKYDVQSGEFGASTAFLFDDTGE